MYINSDNGIVLGVCAGLANWLDIPAAIVRIIFIFCVFAWPMILVGYFILYFCLDKDFTPDKLRNYFSIRPGAEHFRKLDYRKPIYKNEREKRIAGVCAGIADYLEVSHFPVRLIAVLSLFVFGPFTFWAYIICWFVFDPDPYLEDSSKYDRLMQRRQRRAEKRQARKERRRARRDRKLRKSYRNQEFNPGANPEAGTQQGNSHSYQKSDSADSRQTEAPTMTTEQCTELFANLEMRLRDIEAFMTSKKFRLHCEINRI